MILSNPSSIPIYSIPICPAWVYFDAHSDEVRAHDPFLLKLVEDGMIDEHKLQLLSSKEDMVEVRSEDMDEAFRQTLEYMREGRQTIYNPVLIDKHWVGNPDFLERVEGRSKLGDYYYVATDFKRSSQVHDEYKFQGCFYAELLSRVQGVRPVQGYVILTGNEVASYMIEEFEHRYKLNLHEIESILAGKRPSHFVTSGCKQSPWFSECLDHSVSCDDLSLLNRVWKEEIHNLEQAGVTTVDALSKKTVIDLEKMLPESNPQRLERLRDQAVALKEGKHTIVGDIEMPESDIELHFDIESSPLRDFDYLFGLLKVSSEGTEYIPFFAESPDQEEKMWKEFLSFIESHIDAPIYHYGWFEHEVIDRFAARYGMSDLLRDAFERNMIDLLAICRQHVIFPLSFYSLKDIAQYLGFSWDADDAGGANSVLWFEEWYEKRTPKIMSKLLRYNEDDVRATHVLQRWLREQSL